MSNHGIEIQMSSAGNVAYQTIRRLGGLDRLESLSNEELVELFDGMAHGEIQEDSGDGKNRGKKPKTRARTVTRGRLIEALKTGKWGDNAAAERRLAYLLQRGVLRVGLRVKCQHCGQHSWYALDSLAEHLQCERCLETSSFPIHEPKSAEWHYRVVGPFAVENYAQGSYAVALAIHTLYKLASHGLDRNMTWLPGCKLRKDGTELGEADFAAFCGRIGNEHCDRKPVLVLGECKSYNLFKKNDIVKMTALAQMFPGSTIAFCTLRRELTSEEKRRIALLAKKGRKTLRGDMWRNPVLVLTGTELFDPDGPPTCWKGRQFRAHRQGMHTLRDIYELCDITQQLHLNMVPYHTWQEQEFQNQKNKLAERRKRTS